MRKEHLATVAVISVITLYIAYSVKSHPQCGRGCQDIADHLIAHAWKDLFGLI